MSKKTKPKVTLLQFDTYLAVIENSVGSHMFKNSYMKVDGVKKDVLQDGWLSCAYFVSSVLYMFKYIGDIHVTVTSTIRDLQESGWKEIKKPVRGCVIVWKPGLTTKGHFHLGFYVGNGEAISNDSWKKCPLKGDWKFNSEREVEMILWNPKILKK